MIRAFLFWLLALPAAALAALHGSVPVVPHLSAQSAQVMGWSDVRGFVTTDQGSGTLYSVVQSASIADPTPTQVKTCKAGDNTTPAACSNVAILASGAQGPVKLGCTQSTCLTSATSYKLYFVQHTTTDSAVTSAVALTTNGKWTLNVIHDPACDAGSFPWSANPNAATFDTIIGNVVALLQNNLSTGDTHNKGETITIGYNCENGQGPISGGAQSNWTTTTVNYNTAVTGLRAQVLALPNQNAIQSAAWSHLPANDPTGFGNSYLISIAHACTLNILTTCTTGGTAGFIGIGTSAWDLSLDGTTSGGVNPQLYQAVIHEITEVLGRFSGWQSGISQAMFMDTMRFASTGVIQSISPAGAAAYPSSDNGATSFYGSTNGFDNVSGCGSGSNGDCGDLVGGPQGIFSSFNAFGTASIIGNPPLVGDFKLMTEIGYGLSERAYACIEQGNPCTAF